MKPYEDEKSPPEGKITHLSAAAKALPLIASEEWKFVHSAEDAKKWHLKWTPWFTPDMIDGLIKYAYPKIIKEENEKNII